MRSCVKMTFGNNTSISEDINLSDILNWCDSNGITPIPCQVRTKKPIGEISTQAIYGTRDGDSFHCPTPERLAIIRNYWNRPGVSKLTRCDIAVSIDMSYPTRDGYTITCVDVDNWEYVDLADHELFQDCEVFTGKKGIKIFFKLDIGDHDPTKIADIIQYRERFGERRQVIELFTRNKHALIFGEHEASTYENPIFYQPTRGLRPLPVIKLEDLGNAIDEYIVKHDLEIITSDNAVTSQKPHNPNSITEQYGLKCEDFLMPINPYTANGKIIGTHPIHGSTTGHNIEIDVNANTWICRRCNHGPGTGGGGGAVEALAVAEGIITCEEAKPGCIKTKEQWREIFAALERRGVIQQNDDANDVDDDINIIEFGVYDNNGVLKHPRYAAIGEYLIKKMHCVVYGGQIYVYDDNQNIYRQNNSDLESEIITICVDRLGWTGRLIDPQCQILSYIRNNKTIVYNDYPFNRPQDGIPVRNGIIKIIDGQIVFEKSSPKHMFTYKLNVLYDPNADGGKIRNIITDIADGNEQTINTIYEIPAQAILQMQQMIFKKAYLFVGPPNTGKSTILDIYKKLFGYTNIASIQLQKLNDRWSPHSLESKILNIYDDLSPLRMEDTAVFKSMTGTAFQMIEQKHKDLRMGLVNPVHVFSANTPPFVPAYAHDDDGFWVRWGLVECNHVFGKTPNFNSTIVNDENISGFFNDILQTLIKLIKNNYKLTLPDDAEYVRARWLYLSDDLHRFLTDYTTVDENANSLEFLTLDNLYDKYIEILKKKQTNRRSTLPTRETLSRRLKNDFNMELSRVRINLPSGGVTRSYVYNGVVWKK